MLQDQIPAIYQSLLPEELLKAPLSEQRAHCAQCTKAQPGEAKPFRADLKCCTYHPFLPNYLVGGLLAQKNILPVSTKEVLERKFQTREYVLPLGLLAPLSFQIPFHQRIPDDFGNREDWLCPYYNKSEQNCGIWRHRNSTCITYFCKSSYGLDGQEFWISLKKYLLQVEIDLARYCAQELGISQISQEDCARYLFRREGTLYERHIPELPLEQSQALWEKHYDTQESFFRDCHQIATGLHRDDLEKILGVEGSNKKIMCLEALKKLNFPT